MNLDAINIFTSDLVKRKYPLVEFSSFVDLSLLAMGAPQIIQSVVYVGKSMHLINIWKYDLDRAEALGKTPELIEDALHRWNYGGTDAK